MRSASPIATPACLLGDGVDPFTSGLFPHRRPRRQVVATGGRDTHGRLDQRRFPGRQDRHPRRPDGQACHSTPQRQLGVCFDPEVLMGRSIGAVRILRDRAVAAGEGRPRPDERAAAARGGASLTSEIPAGGSQLRTSTSRRSRRSTIMRWLAGRPGSVILARAPKQRQQRGRPAPNRPATLADPRPALRRQEDRMGRRRRWSRPSDRGRRRHLVENLAVARSGRPSSPSAARVDAVPLDMLAHLGRRRRPWLPCGGLCRHLRTTPTSPGP